MRCFGMTFFALLLCAVVVSGGTIHLSTGTLETADTPDIFNNIKGESWVSRTMRTFGSPALVASSSPQAFLVHLLPSRIDEAKAEMVTFGATLGPYIPDHSFVFFADHAVAKAVATIHGVSWVGPLMPENKLAYGTLHGDDVPRELKVTLISPTTNKDGFAARVAAHPTLSMAAEVAVHGTSTIYIHAGNSATRHGMEDLVAWLTVQNEVLWVEPYDAPVLYNKFASIIGQSGRSDGGRPIWDAGLRGQGQIVSIADTGLDYTNCLFHDPDHAQPGPDHRKVVAYDVLPGADDSDIVDGHGTHTSGTLTGKAQWTNKTVEDIVGEFNGAAPDAKVFFQDVGKGEELKLPMDLGAGLFPKPYEGGARVHSNSWGSPNVVYYDSLAQTVDQFTWDHKDFLVVFAAGNQGQDPEGATQSTGSPGVAKNCLTVGAAQTGNHGYVENMGYYDWANQAKMAYDQAGVEDCCADLREAVRMFCCQAYATNAVQNNPLLYGENNLAAFSSRGPSGDGRIKPEVVAPGQITRSAHSNGNLYPHCGLEMPKGSNNAAFLVMEGTSMSTPLVSGLATLVRQYFTEGRYTPLGAFEPPAALIKAMLINSGNELTGVLEFDGKLQRMSELDNPTRPSIFQGFGKVSLDNVLIHRNGTEGDSLPAVYVDNGVPLTSGQNESYCVHVEKPGILKATLVWTDFPGTPLSAVALVNDLDLYVGVGDSVAVGNWDTVLDRRNTVEQVMFNVTAAGVVQVLVSAFNIPSGPQPYSLVLSGVPFTVDKNCPFTLSTEFPDAGDDQYFPHGTSPVLGPKPRPPHPDKSKPNLLVQILVMSGIVLLCCVFPLIAIVVMRRRRSQKAARGLANQTPGYQTSYGSIPSSPAAPVAPVHSVQTTATTG